MCVGCGIQPYRLKNTCNGVELTQQQQKRVDSENSISNCMWMFIFYYFYFALLLLLVYWYAFDWLPCLLVCVFFSYIFYTCSMYYICIYVRINYQMKRLICFDLFVDLQAMFVLLKYKSQAYIRKARSDFFFVSVHFFFL